MLKLAADENLNGRILRGLHRRIPELDVVRVQDTKLAGAEDPDVLVWAADEGRVLLTHDVSTMTAYAIERVRRGMPMPGIVEAPPGLSIGRAIDDLALIVTASHEGEWEGRILFLPL